MKALKTILLAGGASVIMAAAAQAADLPTKKTPPAPAPVQCFTDFWSYLNTSATDCPLKVGILTVTGRADWGVSAETNGAAFNSRGPDAISPIIGAQGNGSKFELAPGMMGQSFVSVKAAVPIVSDFKFIGEWSIAFDPFTLQLADGPGSDVDNNFAPAPYRPTTAGSSSYAGQWDNRLGYLGISSDTFGTVKVGRLMTFANELMGAYDPTGGSYGFSLLGYSGGFSSGFGITETNRYNVGGSYVWDNKTFHVGAETQFGGYAEGNDARTLYSFDAGGKFGGLSIDGIYAHATDAVSFGMYSAPNGLPASDLTATLSNYDAFTLMGRYNIGAFTAFAGWMHTDLSTPTDPLPPGLNNLLGSSYNVVSNTVVAKSVSYGAYPQDKILQHIWIGGKYAINPQLDVEGGYWHVWQNNYDTAATCTGAYNISGTGGTTGFAAVPGVGAPSSHCAGTEDAASVVFVYRPVKRIDTYAGVTYSTVAGGMANGFMQSGNTAFNAGLRLNF